jgi:membrane dipeptidase
MRMPIVDAHLDLAYNGRRGRDLTLPAAGQASVGEGAPAVGLPDLREAGVVLVCGSVFAQPADAEDPDGYRTAHQARLAGMVDVDWYLDLERRGEIRLVRTVDDLPAVVPALLDTATPLPVLLAMEGADPILGPDDVEAWFEIGLRMVGLAWMEGTRYAGGNAAPGPLTHDGAALVAALDRVGYVHDLAHLDEGAAWQLLDLTTGPVCATHANPRAVVAGPRQLSDAMLRAVGERGGVIGTSLYQPHLVPESEAWRAATIGDVVRCMRHVADTVGSVSSIGLGTDADGGFGHDELPEGMHTHRDVALLADALTADGFDDDAIAAILGGNWLAFFRRHLPA